MKPLEMASSSHPNWKNRKERPNQSTNNGYMADRNKRPYDTYNKLSF